MYRVLLVAPRTNLLLVDEEVQRVLRSGLVVTPLIGNVTSAELLTEIINGHYDILWFATHGSADGIQLSDGVLSAAELVPQVRERFRLVVLNTCSSLSIAQMLQEEANVDVVCTVIDTPDTLAFKQGSLLAANLIDAVTFMGAYRRSRFGNNRIYLFLSALAPSEAMLKPLMAEMQGLQTTLNDLKRVQQVDRIVFAVIYVATWLLILWGGWAR